MNSCEFRGSLMQHKGKVKPSFTIANQSFIVSSAPLCKVLVDLEQTGEVACKLPCYPDEDCPIAQYKRRILTAGESVTRLLEMGLIDLPSLPVTPS